MTSLFDPIKIGPYQLKNRIVMAPLTRSRAGVERIPNELMKKYYMQRADAGLILTEATSIMPMGVGYANTPGIWSDEHINGWKNITEAIHEVGGRIFLQLWHVGRVSDPIFLNGELPVAPSAIAPEGHVSLVRPMKSYEVPKELSISEIKDIIAVYKVAAKNAKQAGFDGVEIHGANGYLPDQFLESATNKRTDEYGGSIENRARFLLEATDAAISVWGPERVGVHLSPQGNSHSIHDDNPKETFGYVAKELGKRKIAFLFLREKYSENYLSPLLKDLFGGPIIANDSLTFKTANELVENGTADAVAFGRLFITNPDLVDRFKNAAPLLEGLDIPTLYSEGPEGYTTYPTWR